MKKIILLAFILVGLITGVYSLYMYTKAFRVFSSLKTPSPVGLDQAVVIEFSEQMLPEKFQPAIEIQPKHEIETNWDISRRKISIIPKNDWDAEKSYAIKIKGMSSIFFTRSFEELKFKVVSIPKVVSFIPIEGEKDVDLDIESPIAVTFDEPIDKFSINFSVKPNVELAYQIDEKKKIVRLLPKEELKEGQRYDIAVQIKYKGKQQKDYKDIYSTYFETKKPIPVIVNWERDFNARLQQAMQYTQARMEGRYIDINLKSQIMVLFENGKIQDAFLVSSGKPGMNTPQGTFEIRNKTPRAWSKKYALFMPNWMAIVPSGEYGIHELPEWPGGYKEGANHLGTPVSHGCVRLGVGAAKKVYDWSEIGTPVIIHE